MGIEGYDGWLSPEDTHGSDDGKGEEIDQEELRERMLNETFEDVVADMYPRVDTFAVMSPELFEKLRGQVLAVDARTCEYLWHAPSVDELPDHMPENFDERAWSIMGGPPLKEPTSPD